MCIFPISQSIFKILVSNFQGMYVDMGIMHFLMKTFFAERSFLKNIFFFEKCSFQHYYTLWIAADVHNTFLSMIMVFGALVAKKGEKRFFFQKKCVFSLFLSQFSRYWFQTFRVCRYGYFTLFSEKNFCRQVFLWKIFVLVSELTINM